MNLKMKRDKSYIQSKLEIKKDGIYTKEKCTIEYPSWYANKELAIIGEVNYIYGLFAIVMGDKYSVSTIPTMIPTIPILVNTVVRDEVEYTQFLYGAGDKIIESPSVVKRDILAYNLFETYFMRAKIPWYVEYDDVIKIMDNLVPYAKSNLGNFPIATELVISFIGRSSKNKRIYYRQNTKEGVEFVDLMSPFYSVNSVTNALGGNYMTSSIVSAIVRENKDINKLEESVRA